MSAATTSGSRGLTRTAAMAVFGLLALLTVAGLVLTALARESLWPNGAAAMVVFAFPIVGVLIAWHRPGNAIAWLCLAIGLVWGLEGTLWGVALYGFAQEWSSPQPELLAALGDGFIMSGLFLMATFLLLLFPDGRLPSPRWRWVAWLSAISIVAWYLPTVTDPDGAGWGRPEYENPLAVDAAGLEPLILVFVLPGFFCVLASVAALIRRYRSSSGVERLQIRWLMASGAAAVLIWFATILIVEPQAGEDAAVAATVGAFVLIPAAIGVSVLRYRLYDIDRLISRTLTYALLTAGLAATYFVLVVALQALLRPVTGAHDYAIVVTTLVVAALFLPARRRVQRQVDRRFNRSAYNATQTVEAFNARLREQIDLDTLRYELLAVVGETMQPARASLWLREPLRQREVRR